MQIDVSEEMKRCILGEMSQEALSIRPLREQETTNVLLTEPRYPASEMKRYLNVLLQHEEAGRSKMQSGCTLEHSGVEEHNTLVVDEDAPVRERWPTLPVQAAPPLRMEQDE
ncbi:unnamed protein product [Pleuronectes platessa]|uniref:Uncharacterized protein n=1 Tax=Pleuronectes platessa TaxID=8262 RepID=A0A9N7Z9K3_PLEPL|nr:unnamed protein product [Pleuronectes platessa]